MSVVYSALLFTWYSIRLACYAKDLFCVRPVDILGCYPPSLNRFCIHSVKVYGSLYIPSPLQISQVDSQSVVGLLVT